MFKNHKEDRFLFIKRKRFTEEQSRAVKEKDQS